MESFLMPIVKQPERKIFTYQTRIRADAIQAKFLEDTATHLSQVERALFADYSRGKNILKIKSEYLSRYGITARQFNAIRINLEGKLQSIKAIQVDNLRVITHKINKISKVIARIEKNKSHIKNAHHVLHQKKRSLAIQQHKQGALSSKIASGKVSLCFGGKRLFNRQYHLKKNGYSDHAGWKEDWHQSRCQQFFLLGSKDEAMGNQSGVATLNPDSSINLRIRVPDHLSTVYGKYVTLENITLNHGKADILAALAENSLRKSLASKAEMAKKGDLFKSHGVAINYRFVQDDKSWRLFIILEKPTVTSKTDQRRGAIGVDINVSHLSVTEIDHKGNYRRAFDIPLSTYGKSRSQSLAVIGDAVSRLAAYALETGKPIVIEALDFSEKKKALNTRNKKKCRQLSAFAYASIIQHIRAKTFNLGIGLAAVNPAYSSLIGRVKFGRIYTTLSVHQAAALVIARRLFRYSERLPHCWDHIPDNTGGHLTLPVLVKIPRRHIWHTWATVMKNLQKALAAQYRMFKQRAGPSFDKWFDDADQQIPF
jgi:IS605 OrfB family transposase